MAMKSDSAAAPGAVVSLNDMEMYYEVHGEGEPLLLLHGFFASGQVWQPFVPDLAREFQVILPDLRGHGRSNNPSDRFTHRQAARDIVALLDHLNIEACRAMGISSGGMTLLHMATGQPERLRAMVLIGSTIYFPEEARVVQRETSVDSARLDWNGLRERHPGGDAQIRALIEQFHAFHANYDDMNFTAPYLSTITAPTLIVHGDRDVFFPVSIPFEMYRAIPRSYLWIVPNGDHVPIHEERADPFTRTALAFLRDEWD